MLFIRLLIMDKSLGSDDIPLLIKNLTERYNFLAQLSENISNDIKQRDFDVLHFDSEIKEEFEMIKEMLDTFTKMLNNAEIDKKVVASDFRYIVKKDALERLRRRVDALPYEQVIHRKELDKYF